MNGGAGNDRIDFRDAAVQLDGGDGSDTLVVYQQGSALSTIDLADSNQTDAAKALVLDFENVDASGANYQGLTLLGSAVSNTLIGTTFGDTIDGAGGPTR